ncbi:MAG: hypothetical protein CMJ13_03000 [Pelagibacterales bacterium]|nr:hypothetical protein [Pelagibacterales bacterium]|tara:strand:+ start:37 stop:627 length:591 start_codon:yes stop_codon:yes gene_type:complete
MKRFKILIFKILYYTINLAKNKKSLDFLAIFSFLESIIIPLPPDIFLIPITLSKKYKWFYLGLFTTFFSIFGGIFGYLIGMYFWDVIGIKIIELYNGYHHVDYIKDIFDKYGWVVILIAGFSPIPYKIFTLGSGMLGYNFLIFLMCSIISRGLRFLSLTFLVNKYGEKSINLLENHFVKFTIIISIIFIMIVLLLL